MSRGATNESRSGDTSSFSGTGKNKSRARKSQEKHPQRAAANQSAEAGRCLSSNQQRQSNVGHLANAPLEGQGMEETSGQGMGEETGAVQPPKESSAMRRKRLASEQTPHASDLRKLSQDLSELLARSRTLGANSSATPDRYPIQARAVARKSVPFINPEPLIGQISLRGMSKRPISAVPQQGYKQQQQAKAKARYQRHHHRNDRHNHRHQDNQSHLGNTNVKKNEARASLKADGIVERCPSAGADEPQKTCSQLQRALSEGIKNPSSPQLDGPMIARAGMAPGAGADAGKRAIASYFRQSFYSNDVIWQTDLVGKDHKQGLDDADELDECGSDYSGANLDAFEDVFTYSPEPGETDKTASVEVGQSNIRTYIGEVRLSENEYLLACKVAKGTGNSFPSDKSVKKEPTIPTDQSADEREKSKLFTGPSAREQRTDGEEKFKCARKGSQDYRRQFYNYPILSLTHSEATSTGISPSTFSDTYETGCSGISKVKLTGSCSGANGPARGGRVTGESSLRSSKLHLSVENLKLLLERNLVASLVSVYILVSLTIIVVLILPNIFNLPQSSLTALDNTNGELLAPPYKRIHYQQTIDYKPLPVIQRTSESTQTTDGPQVNEVEHSLLPGSSDKVKDEKNTPGGPKMANNGNGSSVRWLSQDSSHKEAENSNSRLTSIISVSSEAPTNTGTAISGTKKVPISNESNTSSIGAHTTSKSISPDDDASKRQTTSNKVRAKIATLSEGGKGGGAASSNMMPINSPAQVGGESPEPSFSDLWKVAHNERCQPVKVPFCSRSLDSMLANLGPGHLTGSSLSQRSGAHLSESQGFYEKTLLPNQFTTSRQSQIERILQRYEPVIDIKCYALMPLFLCSIYVPKCIQISRSQAERYVMVQNSSQVELNDTSEEIFIGGQSAWTLSKPKQAQQKDNQQPRTTANSDASSWSRLVPPCRNVCKEAFRKCLFFFEVLSLKFLDQEDCESLPESSDPNVCLGQLEHNLLVRMEKSNSCEEDKFRCTDGACIPKKWRCDGFADCTDKSDEDKCSRCNMDTQFYCGQDTCISKTQVCNGIRDCRDGRDERQCLRLSHNRQVPGTKGIGQLQVWNASKAEWLPVCGTHWSAVPMSHEACQALGYSRANETLILFERPQPVDSASRLLGVTWLTMNSTRLTASEAHSDSNTATRSQQDSLSRIIQNGTLPFKQHDKQINKRSNAWFDVISGQGHTSNNYESSGPGGSNAEFADIVEDVVSSESALGGSKLLTGQGDHSITYQRATAEPSNLSTNERGFDTIPDDLAAINRVDAKLKSLTSMLYHGPQAGCLDKPSHLVSTVHLQCQNFQCGRSITSYSSRVRQQQQQLQQTLLSPARGKNVEEKIVARSNLLRIQNLEASEEFDPIKLSNDYIPSKDKVDNEIIAPNKIIEVSKELDESSAANDDYNGDDKDDDDDNDNSDDNGDFGDVIDQKSIENLLLIDKMAKEQEKLNRIVDSNPLVNSRLVVGGIESMPGEFPYLAALHGGPDEVFFCGGVLISINWLLTAAHCVGNRTQPDGWMVKVGITRRIASPAFVKKLKVHMIIKHPNFNRDSLFDNDIALILLKESVEFNQYLRPICLPRANLKLGPDNSKDCVVVGFGKSKFSQEANYLHVAHFVNVPIVRHSTCTNWYAEHGVNLTEGMLCAGYAEGKRDACQGDSGSGLFCRYSNTNQFFVAGVVSFGIKCATPKLPGVYTSVPLYVDWIEATARQHGYPLN